MVWHWEVTVWHQQIAVRHQKIAVCDITLLIVLMLTSDRYPDQHPGSVLHA
jgi:hypothetical protein